MDSLRYSAWDVLVTHFFLHHKRIKKDKNFSNPPLWLNIQQGLSEGGDEPALQ